MSGIEVAGLLLGAFPLIISAMEHYEDIKKPTVIWWKIRRAHKRDYGKIKDCELAYMHQMELLLYPLLNDQVVDRAQFERLLANPGGEGWQQDHIEDALAERLSARYSRYKDVLEEMEEAMGKLCKATKVEDPQFQRLLINSRKGHVVPSAPNTKPAIPLVIQANTAFQAKRLKYSLTEFRREELLQDVEDLIRRLRDLLSASDELSDLNRSQKRTSTRPVSKKILEFWSHADNIFELLRSAWHCSCRSKACLWLQQSHARVIDMKMHLLFCHGGRSLLIKLSDESPTIQIPLRPQKLPAAISNFGSSSSQHLSITASQQGMAHLSTSSHRSQPGCTTTTTAHPVVVTPPTAVPRAAALRNQRCDLLKDGLCQAFFSAPANDVCVGTLNHDEGNYSVYPASESLSAIDRTLADVLSPATNPRLGRVQRYAIALTLASSHLQLHRSAWLGQTWTAENVHFPVDSNNKSTLHGKPYVLANLAASGNSNAAAKDRSFSTLGIVLLELCFGIRLEEHRLWQNPIYVAGRADPMIRQAIACEWADEVSEEAGGDYALAVNWTLKQAPAVLKDDKWRIDFAQNVVQPLQRCYESML